MKFLLATIVVTLLRRPSARVKTVPCRPTASPSWIETALSTASWFRDTLPSTSIASKMQTDIGGQILIMDYKIKAGRCFIGDIASC
jgi:hypothetical protein